MRHLFVTLIALLTCSFAYGDNSKTLRLFIWEDYFPEEVISAFTKQYNIKVEQVFYETDELKNETLINTNGGLGLDLIVGSRASFREYVKHGWLRSFTNADFPNLVHLDDHWLPSDSLKNHSVPYLWGTVGIAYRKDKINTPIETWGHLFKPDKTLSQRIMMINDSRDTLGLALKSLGFSINSADTNELKAAEKLLLSQKAFVKTYSYPELDETSLLVKGDIWVSMIYNGDSLTLNELNPNIHFVLPSEGSNLWVDDIAVLKSSKNPELAWQFINFINEPDNAAQIAQYLYYATPNKSANAFLPKDFVNNPIIYPPDDVIKRSEFYQEMSPRQQKRRNDVFLKVLK